MSWSTLAIPSVHGFLQRFSEWGVAHPCSKLCLMDINFYRVNMNRWFISSFFWCDHIQAPSRSYLNRHLQDFTRYFALFCCENFKVFLGVDPQFTIGLLILTLRHKKVGSVGTSSEGSWSCTTSLCTLPAWCQPWPGDFANLRWFDIYMYIYIHVIHVYIILSCGYLT